MRVPASGIFTHVFYSGLRQASIASWVVVLGPYGLYLLFRGLRAWWRAERPFGIRREIQVPRRGGR